MRIIILIAWILISSNVDAAEKFQINWILHINAATQELSSEDVSFSSGNFRCEINAALEEHDYHLTARGIRCVSKTEELRQTASICSTATGEMMHQGEPIIVNGKRFQLSCN